MDICWCWLVACWFWCLLFVVWLIMFCVVFWLLGWPVCCLWLLRVVACFSIGWIFCLCIIIVLVSSLDSLLMFCGFDLMCFGLFGFCLSIVWLIGFGVRYFVFTFDGCCFYFGRWYVGSVVCFCFVVKVVLVCLCLDYWILLCFGVAFVWVVYFWLLLLCWDSLFAMRCSWFGYFCGFCLFWCLWVVSLACCELMWCGLNLFVFWMLVYCSFMLVYCCLVVMFAEMFVCLGLLRNSVVYCFSFVISSFGVLGFYLHNWRVVRLFGWVVVCWLALVYLRVVC